MCPCVDKPFNSSAEKNADKQSESVTCGPKNQLQITNIFQNLCQIITY